MTWKNPQAISRSEEISKAFPGGEIESETFWETPVYENITSENILNKATDLGTIDY